MKTNLIILSLLLISYLGYSQETSLVKLYTSNYTKEFQDNETVDWKTPFELGVSIPIREELKRYDKVLIELKGQSTFLKKLVDVTPGHLTLLKKQIEVKYAGKDAIRLWVSAPAGGKSDFTDYCCAESTGIKNDIFDKESVKIGNYTIVVTAFIKTGQYVMASGKLADTYDAGTVIAKSDVFKKKK